MHPDFEKNGFMVVRSFFDETTIALMQTYFDFKYKIINYSQEEREKAKKSSVRADGGNDVASSFIYYSDHLTESVQLNYGQRAAEVMRMKLSPTYTFARIYEKSDFLLPHRDRNSCEISATCPILVSDDTPSVIFVSNYVSDDIENKPSSRSLEEVKRRGDFTKIELYPGDVLFYDGCNRYHWREPLESEYLVQFFMHFVETDGKNTEWYFDKRPYSGFPETYKGQPPLF